jgi:hypothetical protein
MAESKGIEVEKGLFEGLFEALADKHSQLDINLQGVNVRLPNAGITVELNGLLTVSVHLRDLTDDERRASAARNVALMSKTTA